MNLKPIQTLLMLTLGLCLSWGVAFADENEISVKAQIDRAEITIGDPVEFSVLIRHGANVKILSTIPPPSKDILKIKKIKEVNEKEGESKQVGRKFTLTAFRLGEFIIDPIKIDYRIGSGELQSLETNSIYLTVKSIAEGEEKTDIRGIKSVVELPARYVAVFVFIAILALLLMIFLIIKKFRKGKTLLEEDIPVLTPEEEAMTAMNRLFDSDLIARGKTKSYYLKLSEILRNYFERRFDILAIESTTFEIIRDLKNKELDLKLREQIQEVLEAADLAKFAKWTPKPTEIISLNKKSVRIVELAKPKEEVAPDGI